MDYSHTNPLVPSESVARWLEEMPQPVAITGGTGFVGSHLVDTLVASGIQPRVLVRDPSAPRWISGAPVLWVEGSLAERDSLENLVNGAGTVLHLAGIVRAGRQEDFDRGNRLGTRNLVAAISKAAPSARMVHVSSLAAAGPSSDPAGVGPEVEPSPISWYGKSKFEAENEVRSMTESVEWTIVRPPAIYGPRDTDVFEFFKMASRGIVALPGGERWLTVAWVGDVVKAIAAAACAPTGSTYHLGETTPLDLDNLIEILCQAGEVKARIVHLPPGLVSGAGLAGSALQRLGWKRLPLTADKTRELLARHWTARTADSLESLGIVDSLKFRDGAASTWSWYRERGWLR